MAGRRETRGRARSSRADSSWPVLAAASGAGSGSATAITTAEYSSSSRPELATQATYHSLVMRGLAPDEAANLTAYLAGIGVGRSHWTLKQINQILFLRQMNRTGQFAETSDRTH